MARPSSNYRSSVVPREPLLSHRRRQPHSNNNAVNNPFSHDPDDDILVCSRSTRCKPTITAISFDRTRNVTYSAKTTMVAPTQIRQGCNQTRSSNEVRTALHSPSRVLCPTQPLVTPLCQTIAPADEFDGHNVWDGSLFGKAAHPSSQPVARHSTKDNYGQAQCIGTTFDDEELYVGSQSEEDGAGVASAGLSRELEDHQGACADDTDEGVRTKRGRRQRVSASHGSLNENEDGEDPDLSSLVDDPLGDDNLDDDNDLGDGEVRLHKRAKKGNGKEAFFAPGKDDLPDVSMITPASTASELSAHADLLGTCGDGRQWFNMSELRTETRRYLIFKTNWDTRDYSCLISRLGDGQADARLAKVGGMRHGRTCGSSEYCRSRSLLEQVVSLIKAQHTKLLYDLEAVAPFVREWLEHEEAGQAYLAGPSTRLENGKQVPRYPEMLAFKNIVRWSTVEAVYKKCLRDSYINNDVAKDPTRPFRKGLCKATMALMAFEARRQRPGFEKRKNGTGYETLEQPELPKRCPGVASQFLGATADVFTAIASDPFIGRRFYKYTTCWKLDPTSKKMVSYNSEPGLLPTPENPRISDSDPNANKGFKQAAWAAEQVDAMQDLDFDHDD
ncbi:BQ5605_C011g06536 [Microbotryum silenes-dioicae]|uniref:BQ5605_C011g06536 protein n=1 Tax=Microbotryum silenes-dioicae TaxID=796604 RepID=A0A2X0LPE2_9BASI|nr:BQ5605_C011g06536 [Microbotryum silenes-dioicae]